MAGVDATTSNAGGAQRWHRASRGFAPFAVCAAISALLALTVAVRVSATGPVMFGEVTVTGSGPAGATRVVVPPVGSVSAPTHDGPLGVSVRLDAVDFDQLGAVDVAGGSDEIVAGLTAGVTDVALDWLIAAVSAAAAVGAMAGLATSAFTRHRRWVRTAALAVTGAAVGASAVGAAGWVTYRSFEAAAFENPAYEGALRHAPAVLDAAGGATEGLGSVASAAEAVSSRIELLASAARGERTDGLDRDDDVVLLHVSDLHLNPLGAQLVVNLAAQFNPDAVVDTGDFTSFGVSDMEAVYSRLVEIGVPYFLVPGNHDSTSAVDVIDSSSAITVLDGDVAEIRGLRITGIADPTFTPAGSEADLEARTAAYAAQRPRIADHVRRHTPDVIGVHNPVQASAVSGEDVTVLSGHTHRFAFERNDTATVAVVGSTGANGLGSFTEGRAATYTAQLLRFRAGEDGRFRLWSLDRVEVDEAALLAAGPGTFRVERIPLERTGEPRYLTGDPDLPEGGPVLTTAPQRREPTDRGAMGSLWPQRSEHGAAPSRSCGWLHLRCDRGR